MAFSKSWNYATFPPFLIRSRIRVLFRLGDWLIMDSVSDRIVTGWEKLK